MDTQLFIFLLYLVYSQINPLGNSFILKVKVMKKIVLQIVFVVYGLAQLVAQNETDSAFIQKKFTIENCVSEFSMDNIDSTKVGYQFWFADKDFIDGRTLKMSVVKPHSATHAPHIHLEDEFFFVLEGTAEFYLDGKTKVAGPYTSFYCPANIAHGIRNIGNTELKYLVIKKYLK